MPHTYTQRLGVRPHLHQSQLSIVTFNQSQLSIMVTVMSPLSVSMVQLKAGMVAASIISLDKSFRSSIVSIFLAASPPLFFLVTT